jgi:hypothetical protein
MNAVFARVNVTSTVRTKPVSPLNVQRERQPTIVTLPHNAVSTFLGGGLSLALKTIITFLPNEWKRQDRAGFPDNRKAQKEGTGKNEFAKIFLGSLRQRPFIESVT